MAFSFVFTDIDKNSCRIGDNTDVDRNGFQGNCPSKLEIPKTNKNGIYVTEIGMYAFRHTSVLEEVILHDYITVISSFAFDSCSISSINLPESLTTIGKKSLTKNNITSIFIPRNVGSGEFGDFTPNTVIASPKDLCTETFIQVGPFRSLNEANNANEYIRTNFFRALVSIRKQDQSASKAVYHYVPLQDFSKPWTDQELYKKYNLTQEEINFIESMIRPME